LPIYAYFSTYFTWDQGITNMEEMLQLDIRRNPMKTFITGGTGFIGSHVVKKLIERGHEVYALTRSEKSATALESLGAKPVWGDITDRESMREGMKNSEAVFHLAAWYKFGARDWQQAEGINVGGTRNVLELAFELGVPKIIYTSTIAVFGDTKGRLVDETYRMPEGPFLTEYDRTKWIAHYEIALPLIEKGAPIIIVQPGAVYGPGDTSLIGQMMNAFYHGWLTFFPGPETTLTYAHVDDIAEGHLLAMEKGKIGESYVIAGPALQFREVVSLWAKVSGKRQPIAYIPTRFLHPLAPLARTLGRILSMPEMFSADSVNILGATYTAHANKAVTELGWKPRPVEDGFRDTFAWIAEKHNQQRQQALNPTESRRRSRIIMLGVITLGASWLIRHRRK
jgi:nucleoside-diphosphate-sugar epimerase